MNVIETHNLTKYYGKTIGIENLDLTVEEGDIFGFIGPNGAGKSTTIRTLLNFIFPTRGSARVLGLDIVRDSKEIRRNIGYIPSEISFYGDLRVIEHIKYSASFYLNKPSLDIGEALERFELNPLRRVDELSSGNKKKLAIIQAFLHQPRLLIMDEPTSGLDPLIQNVFFEVLKELNQKNTTVFFSSHVLSEVQKMCSKIAIIKQGRVLTVEKTEELRNALLKTVKVEFKTEEEKLPPVDGIVKAQQQGKALTFLFNGDIKKLLYALSQTEIDSVLIEEPSLEEVFFHYYAEEVN